jgi:hypothetical protein
MNSPEETVVVNFRNLKLIAQLIIPSYVNTHFSLSPTPLAERACTDRYKSRRIDHVRDGEA